MQCTARKTANFATIRTWLGRGTTAREPPRIKGTPQLTLGASGWLLTVSNGIGLETNLRESTDRDRGANLSEKTLVDYEL
jgi:hypothetical protein